MNRIPCKTVLMNILPQKQSLRKACHHWQKFKELGRDGSPEHVENMKRMLIEAHAEAVTTWRANQQD